jgi:DNA repair exonuclease SbcCD ATPase subunit
MIIFKSLTIKNFLSVGNITQGIKFINNLTLVLGENLDLGANGSRNGTGKTTIVNALSYVLYGNALTKIKLGNLINKTNEKGMLVSVEFSKNGIDYRIERGRKPNILKLFIGDQQIDDSAQGESRETQKSIEDILGLSHEMFKHIVALNTHTEPFLNMKVSDQRDIIEELLGITILSEKASVLKELIKDKKDSIKQENFKITAIKESNKRIEHQIVGLEQKHKIWDKSHLNDINELYTKISTLENSITDVELEISMQRDLEIYNTKQNKLSEMTRTITSLTQKQGSWDTTLNKYLSDIGTAIEKLSSIDIEIEMQSHNDLIEFKKQELLRLDTHRLVVSNNADITRAETTIVTLQSEITSLSAHTCHTCGQDIHDNKQSEMLSTKESTMKLSLVEIDTLYGTRDKLKLESDSHVTIDKPIMYYNSLEEALNHKHSLETLNLQLIEKNQEVNPYIEQVDELSKDATDIDVGSKPNTFYNSLEEALNHKHSLETLNTQMETRANESNPYTEQIDSTRTDALQKINYDTINEDTSTLEHQNFLLKLLTDKDSFVRKQIISQNLSFLNSKLSHYINIIGLRHLIEFKDDLSVEITDLGKDFDFDNLSRGEKNRVILSLSWAFRDVWENLYSPINLLFVDEVIDSGMDDAGVENSLTILKSMAREQSKSIWLISHKNELISRVNNVLHVIKENGFTVLKNV